MQWLNLKSLLFIALLLVGSNTQETNTHYSTLGEENNLTNQFAEVEQGDFVYRIITAKGEYQRGNEVIIYGELEYTGEKDSITIYHAASPFYFPIKELTRDYIIHYNMDDSLETTILVKGDPIREEYTKSGGFTEHDSEEFVSFIKEFWDKGFPPGEYLVNGFVDFFTEEEDTQERFIIEAEVGFQVTD